MDPVTNFAKCIVDGLYSSGATTITLQTGEGAKLPAPATDGSFNLTWWNYTDYPDPSGDPNKEIVRCTARTSDSLTISRGQEGITATAKNTSGKTYMVMLTFTKKTYDALAWTTNASHAPAAAGTATLDLSEANRNVITMPAGNITIALANAKVGQIFLVEIIQDGTGSRTVTWFTTIKWVGGSAPVLTTTANKKDSFIFVVTGSGTYDGYVIGQNI